MKDNRGLSVGYVYGLYKKNNYKFFKFTMKHSEENSMQQLLPNEERFINEIYNQMHAANTLFFISGKSGHGKTFSIHQVTQALEQSGYLLVSFTGDSVLSEREYHPFYKALSEVLPFSAEYGPKKVLSDCVDSIPKVGQGVNKILNFLSKRNAAQKKIRDLILNEKEQDIMCKLQYLAEQKDLLFVCDNINYWDEKSLRLLYLILQNRYTKYDFLSGSIFIFLYTSDKKSMNNDLICAIKDSVDKNGKIDFPELKCTEFKDALNILGYKRSLSEKECELLFSLINGHIRMLVELIDELNQNRLTLNSAEGKPKEILTTIIHQRLKDYGATGEQIKITLEYAALLGLSFSSYELNKIMQLKSSLFEIIIKHSNEMKLIERQSEKNNTLQFAHDIIHEIFQSEISENGAEYYERIELCLREIEPGQYIRRSQYAFKAGNMNRAIILAVLNILKQIREDGTISDQDLLKYQGLFAKENSFFMYYEYIKRMKEGYDLYRQGDYEKALKTVLLIDKIYPVEFLVEKEILCSYCYTKKIESCYRYTGLTRLNNYASIEKCNNERDLYERVLVRLTILEAHLGNISAARTAESEIIRSLSNRVNHDEQAQMRFHTLNRISNAFYDCETAADKMKKAVKYFGTDFEKGGLWRNTKQYYLSQVNYAGVLCLNGEFKESYERNEKILALCQQFPDFPFPRTNIFLNNYLISGYLAHQLTVEECAQSFKELVDSLDPCAERLFFVANFSIFLALSGNVREALLRLQQEAKIQDIKEDKEKIYNYRIVFNSGVYQFLLNNKEEALNIFTKLDEQMISVGLKNDEIYAEKRVSQVVQYISNMNFPVTPKQWEDILLQNSSEFQPTPWNYYGKGYAFTTVFNWDL